MYIARSRKESNFGSLAAAAARLPIPSTVQLKPRSEWKLIGKSIARLDTPAKIVGSAVFGIDIDVPGMLVATIAQCPVFGGTLRDVDEAPALSIKGVRSVVRLNTPHAEGEERNPPNSVAVVADGYWQARQGLAALKPRWNDGSNADLSSHSIATALQESFSQEGTVADKQGDAEAAIANAAKKVEAE